MKNNKGFSLVELIVVIAIMAIIAAVAIPVYSSYVTKTEEGLSLSAVSDIAYAAKLANAQFFTTVSQAELSDDKTTVTITFSGDQCNKAAEQVTNVITAADCENATVTLTLENSLGSKSDEAEEILAELVADNGGDAGDDDNDANDGGDDAPAVPDNKLDNTYNNLCDVIQGIFDSNDLQQDTCFVTVLKAPNNTVNVTVYMADDSDIDYIISTIAEKFNCVPSYGDSISLVIDGDIPDDEKVFSFM